MLKLITLLLVGLVFEAVGVVLLNQGLKEIGDMQRVSVAEVARVVRAGVTSPRILAGVAFEALFFACLLVLMSRSDVSFIWPLTSLGFVLTTIAARVYLHEHVSLLRWTGVALIVAGAGLITWTEQQKETNKASPAAVLTNE